MKDRKFEPGDQVRRIKHGHNEVGIGDIRTVDRCIGIGAMRLKGSKDIFSTNFFELYIPQAEEESEINNNYKLF